MSPCSPHVPIILSAVCHVLMTVLLSVTCWPEEHLLVAVKVNPAVKFNLELKFILGDQDEPQEKIANELSI